MKIEEVQSTTKKQRVATHTHIKVSDDADATPPEERERACSHHALLSQRSGTDAERFH